MPIAATSVVGKSVWFCLQSENIPAVYVAVKMGLQRASLEASEASASVRQNVHISRTANTNTVNV